MKKFDKIEIELSVLGEKDKSNVLLRNVKDWKQTKHFLIVDFHKKPKRRFKISKLFGFTVTATKKPILLTRKQFMKHFNYF